MTDTEIKFGTPEYVAMRSWMRRPEFIDAMPSSFWNDIASEDIENGHPIFREIANRLEPLAARYREASR